MARDTLDPKMTKRRLSAPVLRLLCSILLLNFAISFVVRSANHRSNDGRNNAMIPSFRTKTARSRSCHIEGNALWSTSSLASEEASLKRIKLLNQNVQSLKRVLEREYISFFNPMKTEFYASDVTFVDPLTSLSGVSSYQANVDMLAGRTLLGKILFRDANIVLHSVSGGEVQEDGTISDITTRWTLRFTFQILPWAPTAVFTGISQYHVKPDNETRVKIYSQKDYWDSINIMKGRYEPVSKSIAFSDFLDQLNPNKNLGVAPSAMGRELPYQLLRRGNGYEVRRYPSFAAAVIEYDRRDEGYELLGSFSREMNPLSPAIMEVSTSSTERKKYMRWPLMYEQTPGNEVVVPANLLEKAMQSSSVDIQTVPERVVAVGVFDDALTEPAVRAINASLRAAFERDGLVAQEESSNFLMFAQYDAVYSMGKRKAEVWITLTDNGHPW